MFKARGTRIILDNDITPVVPVPPPAPTVRQPDHVPDAIQDTTPPAAVVEIPEPEIDEAEMAAALGMGFPTLPPNFKQQLLAAQAGDLAAIALMRAIGDQVPKHLQMAFAEMVHSILENESPA